eukprot:CAMPEP_0206421082 /NCGR_PEP_ID=MMETSP0324_2-20121206/1244_1 /ASSEMBLY_ACC=CAM_ASM_000836 /TAXON_ID=2866 /ORGANISM="Crypthecodinium cohnii, Strain Seligo" /LENGTH=303 /DNA_ID=CAMNT_0053885125 /DNA_START=71 /DNA_END=982 /DNA_ORIENTATION=+
MSTQRPSDVPEPAERSPNARLQVAPYTYSMDFVFGQPLCDKGIGKSTKTVITLAALFAGFYTLHFISDLLGGDLDNSSDSTNLWASLSSLLIELSIPACGYCGALYSNRQLTCCFCSSNLFLAAISVVSFIRLVVRISDLDGDCDLEINESQRKTCKIWVANGSEKYSMIASTCLIVILGIGSCWFGNILFNKLGQELSFRVPASALVGEVIVLEGMVDMQVSLAQAGEREALRPPARPIARPGWLQIWRQGILLVRPPSAPLSASAAPASASDAAAIAPTTTPRPPPEAPATSPRSRSQVIV